MVKTFGNEAFTITSYVTEKSMKRSLNTSMKIRYVGTIGI